MEWWNPIPWAIAFVGFLFAVFAYRRNRHPSIVVLEIWSDCLAKHPKWDYHDYLQVKVACRGADIFDLGLFLEIKGFYWYRVKSIFPWRVGSGVGKYELEPKEMLPNPFKNGQAITFQISDHAFRNLLERKYADTKTPSQHWPSRVRLVAYHSGHRRLLSLSSWRFWRVLRQFDYLCRHPERVQALDAPTRGEQDLDPNGFRRLEEFPKGPD